MVWSEPLSRGQLFSGQRRESSYNHCPFVGLCQEQATKTPPPPGIILNQQPSPACLEKVELARLLPINLLLIASLSPGCYKTSEGNTTSSLSPEEQEGKA